MIVLHFALVILDAWGFGVLTAARQRRLGTRSVQVRD
jgi:hypothetical protein